MRVTLHNAQDVTDAGSGIEWRVMTSRPVLYLSVRPQEEAAIAEFESFRAVAYGRKAERWDLVTKPLDPAALDDYALAVVGGSPFNVSDGDKTDIQLRVERDLEVLARRAVDDAFPAMFTCYGIGIVTRLLGGEVSTRFGEEAGPADIVRTPAGAKDPLLSVLPDRFSVLTAHKEGTGMAPEGATLLATNAQCPAQLYRVGSTLYAAQFHPEPTTLAFAERMAVYRAAGYFEPAEYDRLSARVLAAEVEQPARFLDRFVRAFADES